MAASRLFTAFGRSPCWLRSFFEYSSSAFISRRSPRFSASRIAGSVRDGDQEREQQPRTNLNPGDDHDGFLHLFSAGPVTGDSTSPMRCLWRGMYITPPSGVNAWKGQYALGPAKNRVAFHPSPQGTLKGIGQRVLLTWFRLGRSVPDR